MILVASLLVALLLVVGQALWKGAVSDVEKLHAELFTLGGIEDLLRSPKLYLGMFTYAVATVGYIYLLSKFKYFQVQSIVVGGSLVLTLMVASVIFHEHITLVNVVGMTLILCGAILVISQ